MILTLLLITSGVPPTHAQTNTPARTHVVAWGDTISRISRQYGVSAQAIIDANHLNNPDHLIVGQQLIIPGTGGAVAIAPAASSGVHVVKQGENLYRIGLNYGATVEQMLAANNLTNPDQIYTGQRLNIPGSSVPAPESVPAASIRSHTVQPGETLSAIAAHYGVAMWAISQANNIANPSMIYSGQVLTIPNSPQAAAPTAPAASSTDSIPAPTLTTGKQIVVDLSQQKTYAYEDGQLKGEFLVSTGLPATPTVTGDFAIYVKWDSQTMSGPGYYLPGVPWVMYFYRGYALHGAYWHNNFGRPESHGCINMPISSARWLYDWASIGTPVHVQW